jgi:hypothetical protein
MSAIHDASPLENIVQYSLLSLDLLDLILQKLSLKKQIQLLSINSYLFNNSHIKFLDNKKFSQENIQEKYINGEYCWAGLLSLNTDSNNKINNVNHLKDTLLQLNAFYTSGIDQEGISQLKVLLSLNAGNNERINDVNHLKDTLLELNTFGVSGINQVGISELKALQILNTDCNNKIKNVNHLKDTLKELSAYRNSGINQEGISELRVLKILDASSNKKIKNVNHLKNTLEELYAFDNR